MLHNGHWVNYLARDDRIWFIAIVTADIARDAEGYESGTPSMEDHQNGVATVWSYLDGQGKSLVTFRVLVGENGELPSCEANGRTFSLGDGIVLVASRDHGKIVIEQIDVPEFPVPNLHLREFDTSNDPVANRLAEMPELRNILAADQRP
ncbi:MAG: hypothetical protein WD971_10020 [Pirellulales bacterium]